MSESAKYMAAMLDCLCPMHVILDAAGRITHTGPTMRKLCGAGAVGTRFTELFEIKRPRGDGSMATLLATAGNKLHLQRRGGKRTDLKGILMPLPEDGSLGPKGGAMINLSFGISVVDAVRDYALTSSDFAATDLTIEMLYLVEAKTAAMEASRMLNLRLKGAMIDAEEKAYTDTLTGLKNRRALDYLLGRTIESEQEFALIHMDLDFFKAVNDTLGHAAGDHVLREVAQIMVDETRGEDIVARVGGDEFVLILSRLTAPDRVHQICQRLIARIGEPIPFGDHMCRISASAGSALSCASAHLDVDRMMEEADIALYAAKGRGRSCHVSYDIELRKDGAASEPSWGGAQDGARGAAPAAAGIGGRG
ncbi:GGDEF domain-containing protein [Roseovarius sp. LXJ103]|uniref:GGDEF domain-containing protein n=1 Tax=Roseovarius carneus TaxID=2853164 RepID=UPI000D608E72|nr:GGDEF domain-containing protein [Roseovarius carneus]MBZ8117169.1 GGDEF domain-containing protein [Roseovarius carneus]PWE37408.1 GGDEF domain-containing protein [Pelagicola sp. LXJ1103]